uniref:hypothetical protein n=1 Tax=Komagataeibacter kakiaceti TaxID=943261 RepID=UPI000472B784
MAHDEERREQIGKLIWIGIMVVGTLIMGFIMLRNELHALISENEAPRPGVTAPAAPDVTPVMPPRQ